MKDYAENLENELVNELANEYGGRFLQQAPGLDTFDAGIKTLNAISDDWALDSQVFELEY